MAEIQFVLDLNSLIGLGEFIPGEQSLISPMRPGIKLTPEQVSVLKGKGILDDSGKIAPTFLPALETIANAGYYTQVRLNGSGNYLESMVYFSRDCKNSVALFTTGEGLLVSNPAPVQDIVRALKEYIGESSLQNMDFHAEISFEEALALSAVIDLQRRALLKAMAGDLDPDDSGFPVEAVYQETVKENDNAQWLVTLLREMTGVSPDRSGLEKALGSLAAAGLVRMKDGSCHLTGQTRGLANQFMLTNNLLSIRSGREMPGNEVAQVGFVCLQAGVTGLLTIQTAEDNLLQLTVLPAAALFRFVEMYLSDPVAIQMLIPDQAEEAEPASGKTEKTEGSGGAGCPACGKANPADVRFCLECGSPLAPVTDVKSSVCRSCGTPLKPGARFCGECGSAVRQ